MPISGRVSLWCWPPFPTTSHPHSSMRWPWRRCTAIHSTSTPKPLQYRKNRQSSPPASGIKANIKAFVIIIIIVSLAHPFPTISINSHGRAWQRIIHVIMPNICRGSMDMGSSTKLMVNAWLGRRNMMTIIIRQHARQGNICAGMVCAQTAWEVDPTVSNCVKGLGMFGLDMVGHSNGCPFLFLLAALSFCYNGIPCQIIKKVCEATKKHEKNPSDGSSVFCSQMALTTSWKTSTFSKKPSVR